jgi:thioredoxin 1
VAAQHITDAQFQKSVLESKLPVLVDFYATWCGPCKMAAPVLDKLSDELAEKLTIVKMDVDENTQTPGQRGVMSIPTVVLFKDGKEVSRKVGFGGEAGYRKMIDEVLSA